MDRFWSQIVRLLLGTAYFFQLIDDKNNKYSVKIAILLPFMSSIAIYVFGTSSFGSFIRSL